MNIRTFKTFDSHSKFHANENEIVSENVDKFALELNGLSDE